MTSKTVAEIVQEERTKLLDSMSEESLRKQVKDMIESMTKNTVLQLLGFEAKAYPGRQPYWSIDHCNGRAGESAIGSAIKDFVKEALREKLLDEPKLTEDERARVKEEVRRAYLDAYRNEVRSGAFHLGRAHAREYLKGEVTRLLEGEAELVKLRLMGANGQETL